MRRALGRLVAIGLLLTVPACVEAGPDAERCAQPAAEVAVALDEDGLHPGSPSVCRGQEVALVVESELDGVLHVHGYDAEVPAFAVEAGETTEVTFTADRSGQFPVEFHAADDPRGIGVGVFTVHEP